MLDSIHLKPSTLGAMTGAVVGLGESVTHAFLDFIIIYNIFHN